MKKALRYLGIAIGIILLLAGLFAAFVAIRGIPNYKPEKINLQVQATPARLEKGQKLATMLCASCHLDPNTGKLTGHKLEEAAAFGEVYSKNITKHPEYGIGKWTDGELAVLLRTGVKPDGTYLPPYMPKLIHFSDEDLASVITFLRSDHSWVQPADIQQPKTKPSFLAKLLTNIGVIKPFNYPKAPIPEPDTTNAVAWGKYIALGQLECFSCHSKDFAKNDYLNPEKSTGFFGGGNKLSLGNGKEIHSLNITMDEETGIGKWMEETFVKAVKYGELPDGQARLRPPMQPYSLLTDSEAKAIYAYLQTVPKIKNKVERSPD
ncbi:MAG TPA: c-type cytochrome [Chitinophagaceae bacterium]|nr:c-type cytochrome [Chitinophagaceae bacterium]